MLGVEDSLDPFREAIRIRPSLVATLSVHQRPAANGHASQPRRQAGRLAAEFPAHYEIVAALARTRLSCTWKAFDHERQVYVVIKQPLAHLLVDDGAVQRFRQEVQLVSQLSHPNIVPILATHVTEPPLYYTMPFIEGQDLETYCEQRGLDQRSRVALMLRVCEAVIHAHQHGVLHRDLKPNNILVDEDGEPQLLDFGLGCRAQADPALDHDHGMAQGTPVTMAPEQAAGFRGDACTDVYALGAVLFRLLTRRWPIEPVKDVDSMLRRIREVPAERAAAVVPAVGPELDAILRRALDKDPARRYATAAALADDLRAVLDGRPVAAVAPTFGYLTSKWIRRHRHRVAIAGAACIMVLAGLVTSGYLVLREREQGRHDLAVLTGRLHARLGDPVLAANTLWAEHLRHNSRQTRYALWEFFWRYPCRYADNRHGRHIDVAFSPDGRWLVSVAAGALHAPGKLVVYAAETGQEACVVKGALAQASRVVFDPHGNRLFVGNVSGDVEVWRVAPDGQLTRDAAAAALPVGDSPVTALAVAHNGTYLAAGTYAGDVRVWQRAAHRFVPLDFDRRARSQVKTLRFAADNRRLLCAARDGASQGVPMCCVWDLHTGETQPYDQAAIHTSLFTPDGHGLYVERHFREGLFRYNLDDDTPSAAFEAGGWGVRSLDRSAPAQGARLAGAFGDGSVWLWNEDTGATCAERGYHVNPVASDIRVRFSPDGRLLASAGSDGLRVWRTRAATHIDLAPPKRGSIRRGTDAVLSRDGRWIVTAAHEHVADEETKPSTYTLQTWQRGPRTWQCIATAPVASGHLQIALHEDVVARVEVRRKGQPRSELGLVPLAAPDRVTASVRLPSPPVSPPVWLSGEPRRLLLGLRDGALYCYGVPSSHELGAPELVTQLRTGMAGGAAVTPDARWVAACSSGARGAGTPGEVVLWQRVPGATGGDFADIYREVSRFEVPPEVWAMALLDTGGAAPVIATAGTYLEKDIRLWHGRTGAAVGRLYGHRDSIRICVAVHGPLLASSSDDGTVRLWDAAAQTEVCPLYQTEGGVATIAANEGRLVIADKHQVLVVEPLQFDDFIAGNAAFERRRLGQD